jgi:hypothetical protein
MGRRAKAVDKGARRKGYLEDGETIEEIAVVGTGSLIGDLVTSTPALWTRSALAASERNLYVFALGQVGFRSVKDCVVKMPISEAVLREEGRKVMVERRGQGEVASFDTAPLAPPGALIEYVEGRQGSG